MKILLLFLLLALPSTNTPAAQKNSNRLECQLSTEKTLIAQLLSKKIENQDIQFEYSLQKTKGGFELKDQAGRKDKNWKNFCTFQMLYSPQQLQPRLSVKLESKISEKPGVASMTYLPNVPGHDVQIELWSDKEICADTDSKRLILRCRVTKDENPAPEAVNQKCSQQLATERATQVGDQIVSVNGLKADATLKIDKLSETETHFIIPLVYDTGISIPTYTIKVDKSHCYVSDVTYSNREG